MGELGAPLEAARKQMYMNATRLTYRQAVFGLSLALVLTPVAALGQDQTIKKVFPTQDGNAAQQTAPVGDGSASGVPAGSDPVDVGGAALPRQLPVVMQDNVSLTPEEARRVSTEQGVPVSEYRVRARFANVIGNGEDAERMREVVLRGNMRITERAPDPTAVPKEGAEAAPQKDGEVSWTAVVDASRGRMAVLRSPLKSAFATERSAINQGTSVVAEGDYAAVVEAVKRLYDEGGDPLTEDEPLPPEVEAAEEGVADAGIAGVGGSQAAPLASSGRGGNELDTEFKLPETAATDTTPEEAATIGESTEGCEPDIDLDAGLVTILSRQTENGVPVGACSPGIDRLPIQRSYGSCTDTVDQDLGIARPRYRQYYVYKGVTSSLTNGEGSECFTDQDTAFPLEEDASNCSVDANLDTLKATPRSQLTYRNRDNQLVVVENCRATPGVTAYDIERKETGCDLRHDFAAGSSTVRKKAVYVVEGVERIVQDCTDTAETVAHIKNTVACSALIDYGAGGLGVAYQQYRTEISRDGAVTIISDCQPDLSVNAGLEKDTSECIGEFVHNLAGNQSFGKARLFHTLGGTKQFVGVCEQDTDQVFTHQTRITAYEHNDAAKISKPLTEIYITAPSVGDVVVSSAQVRVDAPEIPYALTSSTIEATGEVEYEGCNKLTLRANYDIYDRIEVGGTTEFKEGTGPADPTGPTDACQNVIAATWPQVSQSGLTTSMKWLTPCPDPNALFSGRPNSRYYSATWTASMNVMRDDGAIVDTATATFSSQCSGTIGGVQTGSTTGWGGSGTAYCYAVDANWSGSPAARCESSMDYGEDEVTLMNNYAQAQGWTGRTYRFE
tara:strand:- start:254 stop:2782 length:2529 start_codon:yes stop_codon:yes gene_type:complete